MTNKQTNLKRIRIELNKSKAAIAREADMDTKTYTAIEEGIRTGRDITREAIRQAINRLRRLKQEPLLSDVELFS